MAVYLPEAVEIAGLWNRVEVYTWHNRSIYGQANYIDSIFGTNDANHSVPLPK